MNRHVSVAKWSTTVRKKSSCINILLISSLYILLAAIGGCDPGTGELRVRGAPTANAGPDQTVNTCSRVRLDGSASFDDPEGRLVDFEWEQIAPPGGERQDESIQFTAPRNEDDLIWKLTVTDNDNHTHSDTVVVHVRDRSVLFIANNETNSIISYEVQDIEEGVREERQAWALERDAPLWNRVPDTHLVGEETALDSPWDIDITSNSRDWPNFLLLVSNRRSNAVTVYRTETERVDVNRRPTIELSSAERFSINNPAALAYNESRRALAIVDDVENRIAVYGGNENTLFFIEDFFPDRSWVIEREDLDPQAVDIERSRKVDDSTFIYVANATDVTSNVMVFSHGAQQLRRILVYEGFDRLIDVVVKENTLYVLDGSDHEIYVFDGISAQVSNAEDLQVNIEPDVTVIVPNAGGLTSIAIDCCRNVLYVVDNRDDAIYVYTHIDNPRLEPGEPNKPHLMISGDLTNLHGPISAAILDWR